MDPLAPFRTAAVGCVAREGVEVDVHRLAAKGPHLELAQLMVPSARNSPRSGITFTSAEVWVEVRQIQSISSRLA